MIQLNNYIIEKLKLDKDTKINGYTPTQGEHDKSKVYDDIWDDIKDSLYKWEAGPVYGFKSNKGVTFSVGLPGKYKGYWITIYYENNPWNDSFLITLAKYSTDDKSESKDWEDNVYAGQEPEIIDTLLDIK